MFIISNQVKWSGLVDLKSKNTTIHGHIVLPIVFNGQEIFYFKKPSNDFLVFMMYQYLSAESVDKQIIDLLENCFVDQLTEHKNEVVDVNDGNDLNGFVLKKMALGVDFEELTNVQVIELLQKMPHEIQVQVKNIHEILYANQLCIFFEAFIDALNRGAKNEKSLKLMVEKVQDVFRRMFQR